MSTGDSRKRVSSSLWLAKIIDDSCLQGIPGNAFHLDNTTQRILEKFILSKE